MIGVISENGYEVLCTKCLNPEVLEGIGPVIPVTEQMLRHSAAISSEPAKYQAIEIIQHPVIKLGIGKDLVCDCCGSDL